MIQITDLNDIDTNIQEGKLLMAAMAIITTELHTDKTPYEVLEKVRVLANNMYASDEDKLKKSLRDLVISSFINKYYNKETGKQLENHSDIPDIVSNEIDGKIEELLNSLKRFGIFNANNV